MSRKRYTRKEKLAMADALEKALPYLWDGFLDGGNKHAQICACLERDDSVSFEIMSRTQDLIMDRLAPYTTAREWIICYLGYFPKDHEIQAYRRRWMLALIKELRSN
jgi:hypothetical protein